MINFYNILVGFLIFLCVFTIVNRICTCFEKCAFTKIYPACLNHQDKSNKTDDSIGFDNTK